MEFSKFEELKYCLDKRVMVTTVRNSKYTGICNCIRKYGSKDNPSDVKIHLIKMFIHHKDGTFKTVSKKEMKNKRWFSLKSIISIQLVIE